MKASLCILAAAVVACVSAVALALECFWERVNSMRRGEKIKFLNVLTSRAVCVFHFKGNMMKF